MPALLKGWPVSNIKPHKKYENCLIKKKKCKAEEGRKVPDQNASEEKATTEKKQ